MEKNLIKYLGKKLITAGVVGYLAFCGSGCNEVNKSVKVDDGRNPNNNFLENILVAITKPFSDTFASSEGTSTSNSNRNLTNSLTTMPDYQSDSQSGERGNSGWYSLYPSVDH